MDSMEIEAVKFDCFSGKAKIVKVTAEIYPPTEHRPKRLRITPGVTGFESVYLETDTVSRMIFNGWWACAGTPRSWDSLYISGLQLKKVFQKFLKVS